MLLPGMEQCGGVLTLNHLVRSGRLKRWLGVAATSAGLLALTGLGLAAWNLSHVWKDLETLWRWALEQNPGCGPCHDKLGEAVLSGPQGGPARAAEAESLFRRAIALRPDLPQPYFNLGTALALQGRYHAAEAPLRAYVERAPDDASGPARLGLVYLLQQRYEVAIPLLRDALARKPAAPDLPGYLADALRERARELAAQERTAEAATLMDEAHRLLSHAPFPAAKSTQVGEGQDPGRPRQ